MSVAKPAINARGLPLPVVANTAAAAVAPSSSSAAAAAASSSVGAKPVRRRVGPYEAGEKIGSGRWLMWRSCCVVWGVCVCVCVCVYIVNRPGLGNMPRDNCCVSPRVSMT